ncbi:type II toxin-antitoxin system Phd/YefM family antitoxin [Salinisphaera japonica]|uniref:Antitoxin n=1 Tax=Salinisphaera japonica YTM-1 TaxID=1209778 RepID=A0A423PYZ1_9GAMM|nr:type II toxin-antitoxin system prevent-host-death family antitoxin [Salinisphaera japonica]ROO30748.1 prevent-host-death protein [Salinisphaera japonica YTM-1]
MNTFNIHEAKTHLSRLIEDAANGEPFIIAKAGKPLVKVSAITTADDKQPSRIGFMAGEFDVPDDFDTLGADAIDDAFYGQS